ncbi:MAG TPA: 4Fe-4S binding protein [Syntrophales bacterium]|nr:4Fe-4S binding protein [Syntrophales bacterium]
MNNDVLIIYKTIYNGASVKLADAMAKEIGCLSITVTEAVKRDLSSYKYIGLGSGIYFTSHHPEIVQIVSNLSPAQKVFIFSSHGAPFVGKYHETLKGELRKNNIGIVGEFSCRGFDSTGPFNIYGGAALGRPNRKDQLRAKKFINKILPQYCTDTNKTGNGKHIEINNSKCVGCGICVNICPLKVYIVKDGKSFPVTEEDCIHCCLCKENCPEKAIAVHHTFFEYIKIARHHAKRKSLY